MSVTGERITFGMSKISPFYDWVSTAAFASCQLMTWESNPKAEWADLIYPKGSESLPLFLPKPLKVCLWGAASSEELEIFLDREKLLCDANGKNECSSSFPPTLKLLFLSDP